MTIECPKCQTDNPDSQKFCGECATPLPGIQDAIHTKTLETSTEELTRGSVFAGRYEIIEELGKGGMGRVYRVEDKKIKKEIALKLIKPEIASDKKTIERFKNELTTARDIRHKNVCGMFDLGEEKGQHFITMEYVSGGDLKRFIRRAAPLSTARTISIAKQVCEGLAEAHSLGVVHRDLKPSNIMIDDNGNARIMDFGIARTLKVKGLTGVGIMVGTPEYMSPEQAEAKDVDQRSDIYSMGIILYEMLTGQLPFVGDTPLSIALKHKTQAPPNPTELNPQIPEDLSRVIMICLEKDREKRFQNAEIFLAELTNIEQGIPTTERKVADRKTLTSKDITVSFSLKNVLIPALLVLVSIIVGVLIWQPWAKRETFSIPDDKPSIAILYFKNNTGKEDLNYLSESLPSLLINDLSQSKYLHVLTTDRMVGVLKKQNLLDVDSYSTDDLRKVAEQSGAHYLLSGDYTMAGDTIIINVLLQTGDAEQIISNFRAEGEGERGIPTIVDNITRRVKTDLNLSLEQIEDDIDMDAWIISTGSRDAYKYYSEGRKAHKRSDYSDAILNYSRAIEIDSEFAMAYRFLATCYSSIGYIKKYADNLQKAIDLSDRLTERERLQIQGRFQQSSGMLENAIETYEKLLESCPDDILTLHNLADSYREKGDLDKAIVLCNKAIHQFQTDIFVTYSLLSNLYSSQGLLDKAKDVLQTYVDNFGDHASFHLAEADRLIGERKYDQALIEIDKSLTLDPNNFSGIWDRGNIYAYKGELKKAESEYKELLSDTDPLINSWGLAGLVRLDLRRGQLTASKAKTMEGISKGEKAGENRWKLGFQIFLFYQEFILGNYKQAMIEADRAWTLAVEESQSTSKRQILHFKGLIQLGLGNRKEAQSAAEELKKIYEEEKSDPRGDYFHLLGSIELNQNEYERAAEDFKKALSFSESNILFRDSLAIAHFRNGEPAKALETYQMIASFSNYRIVLGSNGYEDLYVKSFYMLGHIYEQLGNTAKAIEHYEKFLDLWKDADPGLPEVDDAKRRLAGLKGR